MKKYLIILFAALVAVASCNKAPIVTPENPSDDPSENPDIPVDNPDKGDDWQPSFCIAHVGEDGKLIKRISVVSSASFVSSAGYYSFYLADIPGLSKELILNEYEFPENCNMMAISIMSPLLGKKVDISSEQMLWMISGQIAGDVDFAISNSVEDPLVTGGYFQFNLDVDGRKAALEMKLTLSDGSYLWAQTDSDYTPGGENETLFVWGDFVRPVRAAFYETCLTCSTELIMYFTSGQIDYGEELPNTTYARIAPGMSICDGLSHDIAKSISDGLLDFYFRDFDSEWDVISGTISIERIDMYEYSVVVSHAFARDRRKQLADTEFNMVFKGKLQDISITRPIDNKFTYNNRDFPIKSVVVDLSGDIAAIYMLQQEGITTVSAAKDANPLLVNFSASKFGTSIGLSTDKAAFAVSYDGNRWDASNLDTGSFICLEYDSSSGLLHCKVENLYLKNASKPVLRMEYKGTPAYIR